MYFQIEPALIELIPHSSTNAEIATAMNFLTDDWLGDVSTGYEGKCVLIAMALSVIERLLFADRPVFFVTAGKRGGGKTTVKKMIAAAVTGKPMPAAAWARDADERRKAIFAALREGVPVLAFDNIPRGAAISCPTIERVSTSETLTDRILGESRSETVSCATILAFTGNNITPRADLASRSLVARIEVERPDPSKNREFAHPDPVDWTLAHRGKILAALYTILRGNPRLEQRPAEREPAKTRFKAWWHLVCAAVEHGAAMVGYDVDFSEMFLAVEEEDDENVALGDVFSALAGLWPREKKFSGSDVSKATATPNDAISVHIDGVEIPGTIANEKRSHCARFWTQKHGVKSRCARLHTA